MRRLMCPLLATAALLVAAAVATPAGAAPYGVGDLFVSVPHTMSVPTSFVREYTPSGATVQTLTSAVPGANDAGSAFDSQGNFYVTTGDGNAVERFDTNGTPAGTFGSGYNVPVSIVFDRAGHAYVGQANEPVLKFDSSGAPAGSFTVSSDSMTNTVFSLDLAADQCTLEYVSGQQLVQRFDVCTNTQLPALNPDPLPGTIAFGIRVLPDGGVLVADGSLVVRLNQAGAVVQTYLSDPNALWFSLALDPAGTGFWVLDPRGPVQHVDLATGNVLGQFTAFAPPNEGGDIGLSVKGGFVAALAPSHGTVHPPRGAVHPPRHRRSDAAPQHHGCGWGDRAPDASNDPNCRRLREGA